MDWSDYRERIESEGYRFNMPALFADPEMFEALVHDLAAPYAPENVEYVAAIDALGFVPGGPLSRELDAGLVTVRKGGKLPIAEEHRVAGSLVDYTSTEKTLELDRRQFEPGARVLVVDDWVETASQMNTAISLLERVEVEVVGIAVIGAEETEQTLKLHDEYGIHSVRPWLA